MPWAQAPSISRQGSGPLAQSFQVGARTIPQPTIELGLVFELLATCAWHHHKSRLDLRHGCHVAPQFLELCHWKNVFLALPPALLDLLQGNVVWHSRCQGADRGGHLLLVCRV